MTGSLFPRTDGETRAGEQAAGPAICWCVEYHFVNLEGREVCEHECHNGQLDASAEEDREIERRAWREARAAFAGQRDPPDLLPYLLTLGTWHGVLWWAARRAERER